MQSLRLNVAPLNFDGVILIPLNLFGFHTLFLTQRSNQQHSIQKKHLYLVTLASVDTECRTESKLSVGLQVDVNRP